ncbi:outer membrane beta-barrel family protein [Sediminibacterium soli]|uniref:outer membrane beta-barrel family protein n=1 Tax=Sediminibacterium soli TaxID=2698829 RepID=UPI001F2DE6FF|nr:outer membrane beta-barrel family protein [Sediminibacterium soli]
MRRLLILSLLSLALSTGFAQFPGGGNRGAGGGQNMNMGHFYGKVVDKNNKGVEAVTVQLAGKRFDTAAKQLKDAIFGTTITKANGEFSFENLPVMGNFTLKLSALGYKNLDKPVKFDIRMPQGGNAAGQAGGMQNVLSMVDKDLGNIKLEEDAANLGNVTVTASVKPQFELGIDRKTFNVDKNLVSTGQTATEIMKNIPSLNVDIDGNVTMRNAAPQIFIDGRPTTLTLDQIPADIIDKVELISNPSAKYDASGGNAGILNIVLKKNKKTGYNGGLRTGIDSRGKVNLGGDLNLRQNKINFSLNGNFNERKSISSGITDRNTRAIGSVPPNSVHNVTDGINTGNFAFVRGGIDYFVDNRNTFSIAANYVRGTFNNDQTQRVDSTINGIYTSYNNISQLSNANFRNFGSQLSYKHNFAKNGHDLTADINYNSSRNENLNNINTQTYFPNNTAKGLAFMQQTMGNGSNNFLTVQSDYENPISDDTKFEAGVRGAIRNFSNLSDQYRYDHGTGKYVLVPLISNKYKFNDQVYAAYATYTFKTGNWNFQLGLRAESSKYTGNLLTQQGTDSAKFDVKYPLSLFPSAFLTYKIDDKQDFQFNYSRRVNRPNFFQLMPFPDYSDPQNINIGNAGLKPEFTNSFEVSYNNAYTRGANFLASLFFKHNTDLITRFTYIDTNRLSSGKELANFNTYINANSSYVTGLELTNRMTVIKWWDLTANVNIFYSKINAYAPATATTPAQTLSNDLVSWFAKMNNTFKVAKGWSVQFSGDYQAKSILPPGTGGGGGGRGGGGGGMMFGGGPSSTSQGFNYPRIGFDLALRKDWTWKNGQSGSLTLSMNDIFRSQVFKSYSESAYFTQISERRRDQQVLRLNFSYRFGKFDATLFKRKNTKADQSGGQDMMGNMNQ